MKYRKKQIQKMSISHFHKTPQLYESETLNHKYLKINTGNTLQD